MTLLMIVLIAGLGIYWYMTRPHPIRRDRPVKGQVSAQAATRQAPPDDDEEFLQELGRRLRKPPRDHPE